MTDPRVNINVRLSPEAVALVDALAKDDDRTRSDMVRVLLKEAITARQRAGWKPAKRP